MSSKFHDPARKAHRERIMQQRRGRSEGSGDGVLGNVAPSVFPPDAGASNLSVRTESPVHSMHAGSDYGTGHPHPHPTAGSNVYHMPDDLDYAKKQLLEVEANTRKQIQVTKAIAAQNQNQLLWSREQLQDQLQNVQGIQDREALAEERIREKTKALAQQQDSQALRLAQQEDEVTRRLREKEEQIDHQAQLSRTPNAIRGPGDGSQRRAHFQDTSTPLQRMGDLGKRIESTMQLSQSQSPYKDPYDVIPDTASTTYPTPTRVAAPVGAPPRHTPMGGPVGGYAPTILHVGVGNQDNDPVFEHPSSVPNTGYTAPPPPAQPLPAAAVPPSMPWIGMEYSRLAQDINNRSPSPQRNASYNNNNTTAGMRSTFALHHHGDRSADGPVWEAQDTSPSRVLPNTYTDDSNRHGSEQPARYQTQPHSYLNKEMINPSNLHGPLSGMTPTMNNTFPVQTAQQARFAHLNSIIHDMKNGDWFIKWTKSGKPHARWFWLNQKKALLYWSNAQSASVLMSNNIRLEEVVSIKSEQLTEESPTNPRHPQIYYLANIITYKRELQMATIDKDKFNKWFEGLSFITQKHRQGNEIAYAQAANPTMSRVLSRQAVAAAASRAAVVSAAD